jgi:hypothetical protein
MAAVTTTKVVWGSHMTQKHIAVVERFIYVNIFIYKPKPMLQQCGSTRGCSWSLYVVAVRVCGRVAE